MIDLIIDFDRPNNQEIHNLTLKELGSVLTELSEQYYLLFETVRNVNPNVGCTMFVSAIRRG